MAKRHYLELMGIHVWQKRQAAPTARKEVNEATANASAKQQDQVEEVTAVKRGASALLADVRESLSAPNSGKAPAAAVKPTPVVTQPEKPAQVEPTPEFFLALSHFTGFSMANLYPADFAGIPGNHERFLTTLYFALSGAKGERELTEFRWPMVKSNRIPQPIAEAKKVLGRHLQQCQPRLLVFGLEAANLLGVEDSTEVYTRCSVRDRNLLVVEETEAYFREPQKRQRLWRFLADMRRQLGGPKQGSDQ